MSEHNLKIVLVNPQIHWNTGAIGRTCVALDAELIIIHPCGFDFDDTRVKRAGLDYWPHVRLSHYDDWQHFLDERSPEHMFFLSTKGKKVYYDAEFKSDSYLVFGSETAGLAPEFHRDYAEQMYKLPMYSDEIRSLNLANTATAVVYEALRQVTLPIS